MNKLNLINNLNYIIMKTANIFLIIIFSFTFFSCALQKGKLQYEGKKNEIIVTQSIKDFMAKKSNPSIVLRVPYVEENATTSDTNNYIYTAIEKELILAGFNVKDRGLLSEVMNKKRESINYSDIQSLTEADLILELVKINRNIRYTTNKIITKEGYEKVFNKPITRYGASIEFKLIIVKENILAGSYLFYYTPCSKDNNSGCECAVGYKSYDVYPLINYCNQPKVVNIPYEYVDGSILEEFVRSGIRLLIEEIKK